MIATTTTQERIADLTAELEQEKVAHAETVSALAEKREALVRSGAKGGKDAQALAADVVLLDAQAEARARRISSLSGELEGLRAHLAREQAKAERQRQINEIASHAHTAAEAFRAAQEARERLYRVLDEVVPIIEREFARGRAAQRGYINAAARIEGFSPSDLPAGTSLEGVRFAWGRRRPDGQSEGIDTRHFEMTRYSGATRMPDHGAAREKIVDEALLRISR